MRFLLGEADGLKQNVRSPGSTGGNSATAARHQKEISHRRPLLSLANSRFLELGATKVELTDSSEPNQAAFVLSSSLPHIF